MLLSHGIANAYRQRMRHHFGVGVKGLWYDLEDWATLYQDAAGTTPVTAYEQPVGLILDKSGNGLHARQTVSASRAVYSARYNLLEQTENFATGGWQVPAQTSLNGQLARDGTYTAGGVRAITSAGYFARSTPQILNTEYCVSYCVKPANGLTSVMIYVNSATGFKTAILNLATGAVTANTIPTTIEVMAVENGYWRVRFKVTATWTHTAALFYLSVHGTVTANMGYDICEPSVTLGPVFLPYQKIVTPTNYNSIGFTPYLRFDGIDDFYTTSVVDFSSTALIDTFISFAKLSSGGVQMLLELSALSNTTNGTFFVAASDSGGFDATAEIMIKGTTALLARRTAAYREGRSTVLVTQFRLGVTGSTTTRLDRVALTLTANTGDLNFASNQALYIGRRGGTGIPFRGNLYGLLIRGADTPTEMLDAIEYDMYNKLGVTK